MEMFTVVFFVYIGGLLLGVFIGRISKKWKKEKKELLNQNV